MSTKMYEPRGQLAEAPCPAAAGSQSPQQRSRGWRTSTRARIVGEMEERAMRLAADANPKSKYCGGAGHGCQGQELLERDAELWLQQGNCLIHLHAEAQHHHNPSFRVPLAMLLDAQCHPLLDRFIGHSSAKPLDWDTWSSANPTGTVRLFMPPPADSNEAEVRWHYRATRNFFAWALRSSLLIGDAPGDAPGNAWVELLVCMGSYRVDGVDNVADLIDYLDKQGCWDFCDRPDNALAALRLAEAYQLRDVYIDAFSHCVGMAGRLAQSPEFGTISPTTKRLLRWARTEADNSLGQASAQLDTFLVADLSETHLGLPAGARAHLERFRAFLIGFYMDRLGTFPPECTPGTSATTWPPYVYRMLRDDFEALYGLLVDERFTSAENTPFLAQGGICAMQSVHSFDVRHRFRSLRHPLPLLPEIAPGMLPTSSSASPASGSSSSPKSPSSRRRRFSRGVSASLSSFGLGVGAGAGENIHRPDKLRPDERLVTHAALIKATNYHRGHLLRNPLVEAYRRFEEEDTCGPIMAAPTRIQNRAVERERERERVSLIDARKVRWILVYATYQMLRHVTEPAPEVHGTADAPYLLSASWAGSLPPWDEDEGGFPEGEGEGEAGRSGAGQPQEGPAIEIKPDIDYIGMYQQQQQQQQQEQLKSPQHMRKTLRIQTQLAEADAHGPKNPLSPKGLGLSMSFSRRGTLRRSLSAFCSAQQSPARSRSRIRPRSGRGPSADELSSLPVIKRRNSRHNEIVVQGYGNGLTSAIVNASGPDDPHCSMSPTSTAVASSTTTTVTAESSSSTQRTMSTSSHGSNGSKNSSSAGSCNTAATTASPTPTSEEGPPSSSGNHTTENAAPTKDRTKHRSAPCAQMVEAEDLFSPASSAFPGPGMGLKNAPWTIPLHPAPRRASSHTVAHHHHNYHHRHSSIQPRGRSRRSTPIEVPSRSTPASRAPSADHRPGRRSSHHTHHTHNHNNNHRPASAHKLALKAAGGIVDGNEEKALPPLPTRTGTRSWRDSTTVSGAAADLSSSSAAAVAWTIVSPSLGRGNTCPLEFSADGRGGALGFAARMSAA